MGGKGNPVEVRFRKIGPGESGVGERDVREGGREFCVTEITVAEGDVSKITRGEIRVREVAINEINVGEEIVSK